MTKGIGVIVCGGRAYWEWPVIEAALNRLHAERRIVKVVEGGAPGADLFARQWRHQHGIDGKTYRADWSLGRQAGPIRNREMLRRERPDLVVAFPGGAGTADMVRQAREAGVEVYEVGVSAALSPGTGELADSKRITDRGL